MRRKYDLIPFLLTHHANYVVKFFSDDNWTLNDSFHVAVMTPVLHYTMGGLEIDSEGRVLASGGAPLPGLFAAGEVAGGVHGANRLGGSSLLGCVVFGRVSGDTAAAYLLQNFGDVSSRAAGRVAGVASQLGAQPETARAREEIAEIVGIGSCERAVKVAHISVRNLRTLKP